MQLADLLGLYFGSRECSSRYRESLRRTVRQAEMAGVGSVSDLQPAVVNRFLSGLSTSATTRQNVRRELLTLWRWAFEEGLTDVPPMRVMKIRSVAKPPEAWSLADMRRLLDKAESDETRIGGAASPKICEWLPGWIVRQQCPQRVHCKHRQKDGQGAGASPVRVCTGMGKAADRQVT